MIHPLVSVIIPVYNAERYLRAAIKSVQDQTYRNIEILIINDGSTDSSWKILNEIKTYDDRILLISQKNGGISAALNRGIVAASGQFVARMDADDLMLPHRIEAQVRFLQENPELGFCASFMKFIDENDIVYGEYHPEPRTHNALNMMLKRQEIVTYTHPTVTFRTDSARAIGGYKADYEPCEDTEFFGRFITSGAPGLVIPEVLMKYRVHRGSISNQKLIRQIEMSELVRTNFYRRRQGEAEHDPRNLKVLIGAMPYTQQIAYRLKIKARTFQQASKFDRAAGRRFSALFRLMSAALLQPHKAIGHAIRVIQRNLS
ncbi:glycosyltransferase family 2 protein [Methylobacterium flocculans]|uniref:glycosyltransferase family 2 protein n=1 Tax=Methylobacterium flocculans TaxID=2984843 RepID=UPI0021F37D03|nr:glycosyltransferase [Methylobacterium sp. FF17]